MSDDLRQEDSDRRDDLPERSRLEKEPKDLIARLPSLDPVIEPVYEAIRRSFSRSHDEACGELAFAISFDVLHAEHVVGDVWMGYVEVDDAYYFDPLSSVVERLYDTIREWFPHRRAADRRELALHIAVEVLHLRHLVGELWIAKVPTPISADWGTDQ